MPINRCEGVKKCWQGKRHKWHSGSYWQHQTTATTVTNDEKTWNWNENQFYDIELLARELTFVSNSKNRLGPSQYRSKLFFLSFVFCVFKFQLIACHKDERTFRCVRVFMCVWASAHWPCRLSASILPLYLVVCTFFYTWMLYVIFIIHLKSIAQINRVSTYT